MNAHFVAGPARGQGRVHDVSREGFFLRSPALVPEGTDIEVTLMCGNTKYVVTGVVCWNSASVPSRQMSSGFGVRVTHHRQTFRVFLRRVIGQK